MSTTALSWKPILRGKTYCSSACGSRCTKEAFDEATRLAGELCRLLGKGWTPRVHENLGWHASVIDASGCWYVAIYPGAFSTSYTAFLGEPFSYAGKWTGSARTAKAAIAKAARAARVQGKAMLQMLNAAGVKL